MTSPDFFGTMGVTQRLGKKQAGCPVLQVERSLAMGSGGVIPGDGIRRILVSINQVEEIHRTGQPRPAVTRWADDDDLVRVVAQARAGESAAWETLVERFGGLVAAMARKCRLSDADVAEVSQTTWLRLVENLDRIQQPERIGAWLATTSRRESLRIATRQVDLSGTDVVHLLADDDAEPVDAAILRDEQIRAIRLAGERLPARCQRLLGLLMGDDDLPYKEIAEQLNMPIGSIGPTRGRCLDHLRQLMAEMQLAQAPVAG